MAELLTELVAKHGFMRGVYKGFGLNLVKVLSADSSLQRHCLHGQGPHQGSDFPKEALGVDSQMTGGRDKVVLLLQLLENDEG